VDPCDACDIVHCVFFAPSQRCGAVLSAAAMETRSIDPNRCFKPLNEEADPAWCVKNHAAGTAHGQTCLMHASNRHRVQDYVDTSPIADVDRPLCGRCIGTAKNKAHVPSCPRSSVWWDG